MQSNLTDARRQFCSALCTQTFLKETCTPPTYPIHVPMSGSTPTKDAKRTKRGYVMTSASPHTDDMFGLEDEGSKMPGVYLSPRRPPKSQKPVVPDTPYKSAKQSPEQSPAGSPDPCDLLALTTGRNFYPPSSSAAVLGRNEREKSKPPRKFSPSQYDSASSTVTTAGCVQRARRWVCWLPAIVRGPAQVWLPPPPPRILSSVCASQRLLLLNPALPTAGTSLLAHPTCAHDTCAPQQIPGPIPRIGSQSGCQRPKGRDIGSQ